MTSLKCFGIVGQVPGLYQSEELEATTAVLRETAAQTNYEGNVYQYFASSEYLPYLLQCKLQNDR